MKHHNSITHDPHDLGGTPPDRIWTILCVFACLCLIGGCQRVATNTFEQRPIDIPLTRFVQPSDARLTRVAVLQLENGTSNTRLEASFRNSLVAAGRANFPCEVVNIGNQFRQACELDSVLRSGYPLEILAETWRQFHADAILFARIDEFSAYQPLSLGMTIHLVDTRDASLIATLSHHWSMTKPQTRADYRKYLSGRFPDCKDYSIYESSPTVFVEFIFQRICQQLL